MCTAVAVRSRGCHDEDFVRLHFYLPGHRIALLQAQPAASSSQVMTAPGSAKLVETVRTTATVVGIAPATRTVSLKRADGQIVDVQVGEEVRNFDRLMVGDAANVVYTRALSLNLKKGGAGSPKQTESAHVTRAPAGGQPGATVGNKSRSPPTSSPSIPRTRLSRCADHKGVSSSLR
jgi:hypothetical protein